MTNLAATTQNTERSNQRVRVHHSVLPALFVATGLALAYAGALAALLLGGR